MYAELKMDLDYETSKEMKKDIFYQSNIEMINNKNEFIIIEINCNLEKRLIKGIIKELNNKENFIIHKYNNINEEEIFYIKNNELHLIFKNIYIIMPLTCNIIDSIFLQNIINIKLK